MAAGDQDNPRSQRALEQICSWYWRPIYLYIRGHGNTREQAEDLTQGFFERLIAKNYITGFRRERGRFRSFLLAAAKHYLANQYDYANAARRGGTHSHIGIDWTEGEPERTFLSEPVDCMTPETLFAREWGRTVLARTRERLQKEMQRTGKKIQFDELVEHATGEDDLSYPQIASALGLTQGAARVAVHRFRRRYRELLQDEIGQTLSSPDELADEISFLRSVLSKL